MYPLSIDSNHAEIEKLLKILHEIPEQMCSSPQPEFLYTLAKSVPTDGTIVEIGTCAGKSLISMAMARRSVIGSQVHSIDIEKHPCVEKYIEKAGVKSWTHLIIGESTKVAQSWTKPIDLLFIDGDHRYVSVKRDILAWSKWVKVNGMMAFHDYGNGTGVPRAIRNEILSHPWLWQVISDREYGSIFVVKRLLSEENCKLEWREQRLWWPRLKSDLSKNKLIKTGYDFLSKIK
jgi:hypothetical protein